jgi:Trk-type K+ transport system membrane component
MGGGCSQSTKWNLQKICRFYFGNGLAKRAECRFMVIAALNFASHFTAWRERSLRPYWRDAEARGVLAVLALGCLGCAGYLWFMGTYDDPWSALRYGGFNLISIATTTGYASTDYEVWPLFVPFLMLFLSAITASSGSTGGGIKMTRTLILVRQSTRELSRLLHHGSTAHGAGHRGRHGDPQQRGVCRTGLHLPLLPECRGGDLPAHPGWP